jgi:hypothetical protein
MLARVVEFAAAMGTAIFGVAGVIFVVFAPTISTQSATSSAVSVAPGSVITTSPGGGVTSQTTSMFEDGVERAVIVALILVALLLAWLVVAAFLHGRAGAFTGSPPVWLPALLLCTFVILAGFSIGLFFFPSAVLALVTAVRHQTRTQPAPRDHRAVVAACS